MAGEKGEVLPLHDAGMMFSHVRQTLDELPQGLGRTLRDDGVPYEATQSYALRVDNIDPKPTGLARHVLSQRFQLARQRHRFHVLAPEDDTPRLVVNGDVSRGYPFDRETSAVIGREGDEEVTRILNDHLGVIVEAIDHRIRNGVNWRDGVVAGTLGIGVVWLGVLVGPDLYDVAATRTENAVDSLRPEDKDDKARREFDATHPDYELPGLVFSFEGPNNGAAIPSDSSIFSDLPPADDPESFVRAREIELELEEEESCVPLTQIADDQGIRLRTDQEADTLSGTVDFDGGVTICRTGATDEELDFRLAVQVVSLSESEEER